MPRLLYDILHHLLSEMPEIEMVDCSEPGVGIAEAAERARADVVIAGEADATPRQACALLERRPRARALAVSQDGHRGVIYELRPQRRTIGELSAGTVRAAVGAPAPCHELLLSDSSPQPAP